MNKSKLPKFLTKELSGYMMRTFFRKLFIGRGNCIVFMFHRVLDSSQAYESFNDKLIISTRRFENVICHLLKYFEIVDLYDWIQSPSDKGACAITFDDGWVDTYTNAFPVLKKFDIPATVFLPTGMIGTSQSFWFERLSTIFRKRSVQEISNYFKRFIDSPFLEDPDKQRLYSLVIDKLKEFSAQRIEDILNDAYTRFDIKESQNRIVMSWAEVEEMSRYKITFGSHSVNHAILTNLPYELRRYEIFHSKETLIRKMVRYSPLISFPNGNYDQGVIDLCKECGYEVMLTASINKCGEGTGGFLVDRISINEYSSLNSIFFEIFRAKIRSKVLTKM